MQAARYNLKSEDDVVGFYTHDSALADPIADIITGLRLKLRHAFFETKIMPYLEAQTVNTVIVS